MRKPMDTDIMVTTETLSKDAQCPNKDRVIINTTTHIPPTYDQDWYTRKDVLNLSVGEARNLFNQLKEILK